MTTSPEDPEKMAERQRRRQERRERRQHRRQTRHTSNNRDDDKADDEEIEHSESTQNSSSYNHHSAPSSPFSGHNRNVRLTQAPTGDSNALSSRPAAAAHASPTPANTRFGARDSIVPTTQLSPNASNDSIRAMKQRIGGGYDNNNGMSSPSPGFPAHAVSSPPPGAGQSRRTIASPLASMTASPPLKPRSGRHHNNANAKGGGGVDARGGAPPIIGAIAVAGPGGSSSPRGRNSNDNNGSPSRRGPPARVSASSAEAPDFANLYSPQADPRGHVGRHTSNIVGGSTNAATSPSSSSASPLTTTRLARRSTGKEGERISRISGSGGGGGRASYQQRYSSSSPDNHSFPFAPPLAHNESEQERQRQSYAALQESIQQEEEVGRTSTFAPTNVRLRPSIVMADDDDDDEEERQQQGGGGGATNDGIEVRRVNSNHAMPNAPTSRSSLNYDPYHQQQTTSRSNAGSSSNNSNNANRRPQPSNPGAHRMASTRRGSHACSGSMEGESSSLKYNNLTSDEFSMEDDITKDTHILDSVLAVEDDVEFRHQAKLDAEAKVLATVAEAQVLPMSATSNKKKHYGSDGHHYDPEDPDGEEEEGIRNKKRKFNICLLILLVILVSGLVGGIVGFVISNNADDGGNDKAAASDDSDDGNGITQAPITMEQASPPPSQSPPIDGVNPHDTCATAVAIDSLSDLPMAKDGSTQGARSAEETGSNVPICPGLELGNGRGVWYKLSLGDIFDSDYADVASLLRFYEVSLCNSTFFDTQISIFKGTSCNDLECVTANDQRQGCSVGDQSQLTWEMDATTFGSNVDDDKPKLDLYLLVHGVRGATGNYQLSFNRINPDLSTCEQPKKIVAPSQSGAVVLSELVEIHQIGTVLGRPHVLEEHPTLPMCQNVPYTSSGAWFTFESASTGFLQVKVSEDFGGRITLFRKINDDVDGCDGNMRCVVASNAGVALSTVERGETYFVLVHQRGGTSTPISDGGDAGIGASNLLGLPPAHDFTVTLSPGGFLNDDGGGVGGELILPGSNRFCAEANRVHLLHNDSFINQTMEETGNYDERDTSLPPTRSGHANGNTKRGEITPVPVCSSESEEFFSQTSPGAWYTLMGTGNLLTATTCDTNLAPFDTQMTVLMTNDCEDFLCVGSNDQSEDAECGDFSTVTWNSIEGQAYYIYIHGVGNRVGSFNLTITESEPSSEDACEDAIPLDDALGSSVFGTFRDAKIDDSGLDCTNEINVAAAVSVWYTVEGTGNEMMAYTCDHTGESDIATDITLFEGTNEPDVIGGTAATTESGGKCDGLACVRDYLEQSCDGHHMVLWNTEKGTEYKLRIAGSSDDDADPIFKLTINETPYNARCPGAVEEVAPWARSSPIRGYTHFGRQQASSEIGGGIRDDTAHQCDKFENGSKLGSWHKISATAGMNGMSASVCSDTTSLEAKLTVFRGDGCGNLECLATNQGVSCGEGSAVKWDVAEGEEYWILVQGSSPGMSGAYALEIAEGNNVCDTAIQLSPNSTGVMLGSLQYATPPQGEGDLCFPVSLGLSSGGVWYSVTGENEQLWATTCHPETNFAAKVLVYAGNCGQMECVGVINGDDDVSEGGKGSVSWFAQKGIEYKILVHGETMGDFGLSVEAIDNHECDTAVPFSLQDQSIVSSFSPNTPLVGDTDVCSADTANSTPSWYTVTGTGATMLFDNCNVGADVQVSIANGTECNALTCAQQELPGDDGGGCQQSIPTTYGEEYKVLVSSSQSQSNQTSTVSVRSDHFTCLSAHGPIPVGSSVHGEIDMFTKSNPDDYETCDAVLNDRPGLWYKILGTGKSVTAFTCSEFSLIPTQMSVLTGSCGNLTCIKGRRDNCGKHAWATFPTVLGQEYYIHVMGVRVDGEFVLTVV